MLAVQSCACFVLPGQLYCINFLERSAYRGCSCRHYVDKLCQYTTGVSHAASLCKRTTFRQRRATPHWSDSVITLAHAFTDVANWPKVQAATQVMPISNSLASLVQGILKIFSGV